LYTQRYKYGDTVNRFSKLIKIIKELNLTYYTEISVQNNQLVLYSTYSTSTYISTREMIILSEILSLKIYDIAYLENTITIKEKNLK